MIVAKIHPFSPKIELFARPFLSISLSPTSVCDIDPISVPVSASHLLLFFVFHLEMVRVGPCLKCGHLAHFRSLSLSLSLTANPSPISAAHLAI